MTQIELRRAQPGMAVLTVQYEIEDVEQFLQEFDNYGLAAAVDMHEPQVMFFDHPASGSKVTDLLTGEEAEGPAEFTAAANGAAPQGGAEWWKEQNKERDGRFD